MIYQMSSLVRSSRAYPDFQASFGRCDKVADDHVWAQAQTRHCEGGYTSSVDSGRRIRGRERVGCEDRPLFLAESFDDRRNKVSSKEKREECFRGCGRRNKDAHLLEAVASQDGRGLRIKAVQGSGLPVLRPRRQVFWALPLRNNLARIVEEPRVDSTFVAPREANSRRTVFRGPSWVPIGEFR